MTSSNDPVIAGPNEWRYEMPPRSGADVWLLTVGRVAVRGQWTGEYGQHFIAWAPMPKRNKQREKELGLL